MCNGILLSGTLVWYYYQKWTLNSVVPRPGFPAIPRVLVYVTCISSKEATPVISFPAIPVALLWHQIPLWLPSLALLLAVEHVASAAATSKIINYYKLPFGHMQWFFNKHCISCTFKKEREAFKTLQTSKLWGHPVVIHVFIFAGSQQQNGKIQMMFWSKIE